MFLILTVTIFNLAYAQKAYFDLSQDEINIKTNFTGQELILFGLVEPGHDIIIVVKGPNDRLTVRNKKRLLGFWFNTSSVTFINIPKVYFISSYKKIDELLEPKQRYDHQIGFENIKFIPENKKDLFIDLSSWNESVIRIQKENNLYKHFDLKIVDDRLFQTRLYFPSNIPMGMYTIRTYKINNGDILGFNDKILLINKSGIGSKIYLFAKKNTIIYGIIAIIFAIILGISAATIFRKL